MVGILSTLQQMRSLNFRLAYFYSYPRQFVYLCNAHLHLPQNEHIESCHDMYLNCGRGPSGVAHHVLSNMSFRTSCLKHQVRVQHSTISLAPKPTPSLLPVTPTRLQYPLLGSAIPDSIQSTVRVATFIVELKVGSTAQVAEPRYAGVDSILKTLTGLRLASLVCHLAQLYRTFNGECSLLFS